MSAFSMLSSIGGQWPFNYCHDIGLSAVGALRTLKSTFLPAYSYASPSAAAAGVSLLAAANQHQYTEKLGWVIQTRFHFGNQLSRYVGVSIFVRNNVCRLGSIARASGLVLLVGVGSYFAYRLCLKLFGCRDLASLLHCLCKNETEKNANETGKRLGQCRRCKRHQAVKGAHSPDDADRVSCTCSSCGESGQKVDDALAKGRKHRRRLYSEANEDGRHESSTGTSGSQSEQSDNDEENPTEVTDLGSECSSGHASNAEAAPVDAWESGAQPSAIEPEKRRWRNSARKRTNALDDPNAAGYSSDDTGDSDESVTGFSKSRSPPPIPRFQTKKINQGGMSQSMPAPTFTLTPSSKAPSVKSLSVQSVPSSQQFIWDPVCTPGDEGAPINDELLSYFADVPTGELVQRFLDGLFLSSDQNRVVSPGPSETASEFSLAADRQIGDCTAENFERIQCDLSELRTDVDEFDAELTTYLQERRDCLKSDSRVFYRSVIVDDNEDAMTNTGDAEDSKTPSPTPPSSPEKPADHGAAKLSPCRRLSNKRHRKSHESSNGSSTTNAESKNNDGDGARSKKRRRRYSDRKTVPEQQQERRDSTDGRHTLTDSSSNNEKSALSLDTGYVSSYHTMISSADSGPCSPSSVDSAREEDGEKLQRNQSIQGFEKRPTDLALPAFVYDLDSDEFGKNSSETSGIAQTGSDESGKPPSLFDSLPSSSSCGVTPDGSWRKRPTSAMSLEWEDEMFGTSNGASPALSARSRSGKGRLKAVDLLEFLRLYYNVDSLEAVPKMYQIGRKLTKRGYRRVLLYNDVQLPCRTDSTTSERTSHLDNLIAASLIGAAHFRRPIFKCQSFRIVPEAVDVSMKRCSFFAERCSTYFGSTTPEGTRAYILRCMQKLWQLHESVQQNELQSDMHRASPSSPSSSWALIDGCMGELIDGMKVLMALRSLETYEEILFTRRTPFPFYTDLFRIYTPASYAEQKLFRPVALSSSASTASLDDLDIALLADTLGVRIEMFRPNSSHPESVAVYPELEHNANLSRPRLPLLEPSTSDVLYLPLI